MRLSDCIIKDIIRGTWRRYRDYILSYSQCQMMALGQLFGIHFKNSGHRPVKIFGMSLNSG